MASLHSLELLLTQPFLLDQQYEVLPLSAQCDLSTKTREDQYLSCRSTHVHTMVKRLARLVGNAPRKSRMQRWSEERYAEVAGSMPLDDLEALFRYARKCLCTVMHLFHYLPLKQRSSLPPPLQAPYASTATQCCAPVRPPSSADYPLTTSTPPLCIDTKKVSTCTSPLIPWHPLSAPLFGMCLDLHHPPLTALLLQMTSHAQTETESASNLAVSAAARLSAKLRMPDDVSAMIHEPTLGSVAQTDRLACVAAAGMVNLELIRRSHEAQVSQKLFYQLEAPSPGDSYGPSAPNGEAAIGSLRAAGGMDVRKSLLSLLHQSARDHCRVLGLDCQGSLTSMGHFLSHVHLFVPMMRNILHTWFALVFCSKNLEAAARSWIYVVDGISRQHDVGDPHGYSSSSSARTDAEHGNGDHDQLTTKQTPNETARADFNASGCSLFALTECVFSPAIATTATTDNTNSYGYGSDNSNSNSSFDGEAPPPSLRTRFSKPFLFEMFCIYEKYVAMQRRSSP
jgi:hypothetical protein